MVRSSSEWFCSASYISSGLLPAISVTSSGRALLTRRCIMRVDTIEPTTEPNRPTMAAVPKPRPIMNTTTTRPIPNAVPKLVSDIN